MKIFIYIMLALAAALLIFNITKIDFNAPLEGNSTVAIISVLACACAIVLLLILQISKKIAKKH
ncbi:MAG: hypothetical protein V7767_00190 [Leeuwenhoekiella sp.]